MNREFMKNMLDLYDSPLFAQSFLDFSARMQQMGTKAAKQFWQVNHPQDTFPGNATDIFERMVAFYSSLGFVPKKQYDDALRENEQLKKENESLKATLKELNFKILTEGNRQVQEMWTEIAHKHMDVTAQITDNFLGLFKKEDGKQ